MDREFVYSGVTFSCLQSFKTPVIGKDHHHASYLRKAQILPDYYEEDYRVGEQTHTNDSNQRTNT